MSGNIIDYRLKFGHRPNPLLKVATPNGARATLLAEKETGAHQNNGKYENFLGGHLMFRLIVPKIP